MQEPFDENTYLVQFPIWILKHPSRPDPLTLNGEGGALTFPLFSDDDLADRFRASVPPLAHYVFKRIKDRQTLWALLGTIEAQGVTHVSVDPTNREARCVTLAEARESLLKNQGPIGDSQSG